METIRESTEIAEYHSPLYDEYFGDARTGFLDLETTGLSPERCSIILAGLTVPGADGRYEAIQFFADRPEEEADLLCMLYEELSKLDVIATYNGHRFDLPFLQKRTHACGLRQPDLPYELDFYRLVRYHSDIRNFLPNLRQKTLEDFLGLWTSRDDVIDGGESVRAYYSWLRTGDASLRDSILLHNHDDILQLARLTAVIDKTDFHQAMTDFGFPTEALLITDISVDDDVLQAAGRQRFSPADYVCFGDDGLSFTFSGDGSFHINFPLCRRSGILFADTSGLGISTRRFDGDPALYKELLIIDDGREFNYRALNLFVCALTERIIEKWITKK